MAITAAGITRTVRIIVDARPAREGGNVVKRTLQDVDDAAQKTEARVQQFGSALTALKGIMAGLGIGALLREFVQAGLAMNSITSTLKAVTDSAALAAVEMAFLRAEANRLGLDLKSSAEAYGGLAAAAKGTSLEGEQTRKIFVAVSEAMTALGRNSEQTQGALLAIQQMMSKGTVQAEELRGQLGERLPGAFQMAAKAMGVTTAELGKMLEGGKVISEDFLPKFAKALHDAWGQGALDAARGLQANLNRMQNAITEFGAAVLNSGFGDALNEAITKGLNAGNITAIAAALGNVLGEAVRGLTAAVEFLAANFDAVAAAAALFLSAKTVSLIAAITTGLWGMVAAGIAFAATPFGAVVTAIAAITAALVYFRNEMVEVGDRSARVWDILIAGVEVARERISDGVNWIREKIDGLPMAVMGGIKMALNAVIAFGVSIVDVIGDSLSAFGTVVTNFFGELGTKLVSIMSAIPEAISLAVQGEFAAAGDAIGRAIGGGFQLGIDGVWAQTRQKIETNFSEDYVGALGGIVVDGLKVVIESGSGAVEGAVDEVMRRAQQRAIDRWAATFTLEADNLAEQAIPRTTPRVSPIKAKDGGGKGIESYYQQQTAALTKQLETFLQLDDAAENYFEAVKRGGKGLTQSQAEQLAALQNTLNAFKALDKAGKGLQSAMDAIRKDPYSGATSALAKLIEAQRALPGAASKAREELAKAKLGTDAYEKAQAKLSAEMDRFAASGESYKQGLEAVTAELGQGVAALRDSVSESQAKSKALDLEIDGSDEARKALQELTRQRALDVVQQEREKALGPLRAQLRQAEADGYEDIAEALRGTIAEYENLYKAKAAADVEIVDKERLKADAEEAREAFQEPFREAARSIQSSLADTFANVFRGGIKSFKDLGKSILDIFITLAAQIAALLVFRPVVGGLLESVGASDSFMRSLGIAPTSSAGGAGGPSLFGTGNLFGSGNSLGGWAGDALAWANKPFMNIGGTTQAYPTAVGEATGTFGGIGISPMDIAGPILSALPGLLSGNYAQAALGAGGFAIGNLVLPGVGGPIGAMLGNLLGGFFGSKPSNKGAEYAFNLGDYSTAYEGTKHAEQMDFVRGFAQPIQSALDQINQRFGVSAGAGSVIGANYGVKEGSSLYYQPTGGGIEDRQRFEFDPEDAASVQAAIDSLMVAYLKDADWSGIGSRLGAQSAADVATALENSAATTLDEILADVDFASSFQSFIDLAAADLDPVALAMRAIGNEGKALASTLASNVDTFRAKAAELGLGGEMMADGLTRADQATQGYILSVLGIEAPLDDVTAATQRANTFIADLVPILESAGFSMQRIGEITSTVFDRMVADAQAAAAQIAQAAITAQVNSQNLLNSTIFGSNYQPPADSFLYGLVGGRYEIPSGGGAFAPLVNALNGARAGDQAALIEAFNRAQANETKGVFTAADRAAVEQYASQLYTQAQARIARNNPVPANDNGSVTSSGGGGSAANDNSVRDALQEQVSTLQDLARVQQDAAREAERMANAFKSAGDSLRLYRLGLLTDPTNNPASLGDQLAEAQRQQAAALARVLAGGPDAPDAARELQQVSDTVLSLGRSVFGSSPQYVALFDRTIGMLTSAETATVSFETQQIALATTANTELARLNDQIEALRAQMSASSGGGSSGGGGGGGGSAGGGGGTPTAPGQSYAFGYSGLGRTQGETADAFIRRQFPKVAEQMGPGAISEQAGYNWSQSAHASGLPGLTNAGYFSAAIKAGFPGPFVGTAHNDYLRPNGVWVDQRIQSFITELRKLTTVPVGYFGYNFALGGLVTGGVPGMDSVPAMLMPGERVFSVPHSRIIESLVSGRANDNGEMVREQRQTNVILDRRLGMIEARLAQIEGGQERGNATREGMRQDAKAAGASRAPKVGGAPIRTAAGR